MLTPSSTPNQIRSMPSLSATGPSSGTTMKASSKKSRKKASTKTRMLTTIRKPSWPPGRLVQQVLDPQVAVDAVERQAEHARADQDEDHEGGQLGGRVHRLPQQLPATGAGARAPGSARRSRPWRRPRSAWRRRGRSCPAPGRSAPAAGSARRSTRSASCDSRPSFSDLVDDAAKNATPAPTLTQTTSRTSVAASGCSAVVVQVPERDADGRRDQR